jgi:hypothetical protein
LAIITSIISAYSVGDAFDREIHAPSPAGWVLYFIRHEDPLVQATSQVSFANPANALIESIASDLLPKMSEIIRIIRVHLSKLLKLDGFRLKWNSPHSILRARIKGRNIYILLSSSIIAELEQNS